MQGCFHGETIETNVPSPGLEFHHKLYNLAGAVPAAGRCFTACSLTAADNHLPVVNLSEVFIV